MKLIMVDDVQRQMRKQDFTKRAIDIIGAVVGLVGLSPILLALSLLVRITMGKPVFFRQVRAGRFGKPIRTWKFRTMTNARDTNGVLLPDGERLTCFGRFLREYSLDELPQFWNVLKKDMSLVGPRPLLLEYLKRYTPEQARRHEVKPGITGWAQVNGRNALTWEEKFELDVWYVDHWSFLLDTKIILVTVFQVLRRQGITAEGSATMQKYRGPGK